jgi:glycosyltransferase involved in cell wall biosynthesis
VHACTIVARNRMAYASVLAESFLHLHRGSRFTILVVDGEPGEIDDIGRVRVLTPVEAGVKRDDLQRLATVHESDDLTMAMVPRLLEHLLDEREGDVVVYLAAPTVLYDDITNAVVLARRYGLVLVPRALRTTPRDGRTFDDGFVAVSSSAAPLLRSWVQHTHIEPGGPDNVDTPFLDLVPAMFDNAVWRDPGVSAGYWNLHERPLTLDTDGRVLAAGTPLRTMNFVGYDPDRPYLLSTEHGDRPHVRLSAEPVLTTLADAYRERLLRAGHERWDEIPCRFDAIGGGPVPTEVRRLVQVTLLDEKADDPPLPFGDAGDDDFIDWLNEPVAGRGDRVLTRLLHHVYNSRSDLQHAFQFVPEDLAEPLSAWAASAPDFLAEHGHLHRPIPRPNPPSRAAIAGIPHHPPGYNLVGYLGSELGLGEAGRLMALAADAGGVPHHVSAVVESESRQLDPFGANRRSYDEATAYPYAVNLLCFNADWTPHLLRRMPEDTLAGRHRVGLWFWELDSPGPGTDEALPLVDEVWVTSEFVADVLRPLTDKPVLVTPLAVRPPVPTHLHRADLGLPSDRRIFLTSFDAFSGPGRKNPAGVVAAYRQAFDPDDGAHLVIKAINGSSRTASMEELWYLTRDRPDIEIRDDYLSRTEMSALVQLSDVYVSLHRSEGFGLVPAAAMAAGKPVVATAYSGTLSFMDEGNSLLVPYELVDVGEGQAPYPPDGRWAEPDLEVAAAHLRRLIDEPHLGRALGARARVDIARSHGPDVAGEWMARRLNEIVGSQTSDRTRRCA